MPQPGPEPLALAPERTPPMPPGFDLDGFPAAFRLACACCMWPRSAARDTQVRLAAEGVDWNRFLRVAARQRVVGLARDGLKFAGVAVPPEIEARLVASAQGAAARSLGLAAESLRLRRLFDVQAIPALFIKGASLAQLAYGSQTLKAARDVDVLVDPADAERAFSLLAGEGYDIVAPAAAVGAAQRRLVFRLHKDLELRHRGRGFNLELHGRLIDNPVLLRGVGVGSPTQDVPILDGSLPTLGDAQLFAYLCVHGASHAWFRLKWLADLNAWLSGKSEAEIVGFYRFAEQLGVEACAAQALRLCNRLLGLTPPAALAPALARRKVRLLSAAALDAMVGPDAEVELAQRPFGPFRTLPMQFLRGRGGAFHLAQLRMLVQNLDDMLMYPLPRPLHFLYPLLRLPLWLVRVSRRRRRSGPQSVRA